VVRIAALAARRPWAGAIGPLLRSPNGTVQRSTFASPPGSISLALWVLAPTLVSGAYRGWQLLVNARGRRQGGAASGETRDIVGLEYLQGSALLLRREAFDAVGGFDERFFMYCEEADLCYRLREAGWSVLFAPDCEFVHVGEASSKHRPDEMYGELLRSHVRLLAKHRGIAVGERARRLVVLGLRLRAALHAGPRRAQYALASARLASDNQLRLTFGP
jgi:N-acetylglucosaminyl-diphospho-decaprenol L-rhamnosyltransferase